MRLAKLEITGFAVFWDENGNPTVVEAEHVPPSGRKIEPDPRIMREARKRLHEREKGSDSSNPHAA